MTYFFGTAQMYLRMIDADGFASARVDTLRWAVLFFANGFNESDFERIEDQTGVSVCQPYGLSEANTQLFVGDPNASSEQRKKWAAHSSTRTWRRRLSIGDARRPAGGKRGELALRGYNVMQEYLDKPTAMAEVFDDEGWFYTGDLCVRDDAGCLYYHSRIDDALRVRGFLVSPGEIEAALEEQDDVAAAQVVGAPHPTHGQVPVAFLVGADGAGGDTDCEALLDSLAGQIADYKAPKDVIACRHSRERRALTEPRSRRRDTVPTELVVLDHRLDALRT